MTELLFIFLASYTALSFHLLYRRLDAIRQDYNDEIIEIRGRLDVTNLRMSKMFTKLKKM